MAELYIRGKDGRPRHVGSTADPQLPGRVTALEERMGALESAPGGPGFALPVATPDTLGGIRPDGKTLVVEGDGAASVVGYGGATASAPGTTGLVPSAAAGCANRYLSAWGIWAQGTTRKILTGAVTLHVRQDGSDDNDGTSDDASHAFRTINAALGHVAERLLPGNSSVVIQVADGVFQEMVNVPRISSRGGRIVIRGSGKGTVLERNNGGCVYGAHGSYVELENLTVRSRRTEDVSYAAAGVSFGSGITLRNVAVEVVDDSLSETQLVPLYCYARNGMLALEDVSISLTGTNSRIFPAVVMQGGYATFSGSMAVSGRGSAFIRCTNGGLVTCYGNAVSFSGSFTGKRYSIDTMSCIDTNGQGPDYLPGDQAGVCDDSSAYL